MPRLSQQDRRAGQHAAKIARDVCSAHASTAAARDTTSRAARPEPSRKEVPAHEPYLHVHGDREF